MLVTLVLAQAVCDVVSSLKMLSDTLVTLFPSQPVRDGIRSLKLSLLMHSWPCLSLSLYVMSSLHSN